MESPIGPLLLVASHGGLVALEFERRPNDPRGDSHLDAPLQGRDVEKSCGDSRPRPSGGAHLHDSPGPMRPYIRELEEYFAGARRQFAFPLDLRGTNFQLACWRALLDIPCGETRTYADIARVIGKPQAFRAVGMANNRNPIAIIVPCHRVIASDGTLCGYGGGLDVKRKLLELEGALTTSLVA